MSKLQSRRRVFVVLGVILTMVHAAPASAKELFFNLQHGDSLRAVKAKHPSGRDGFILSGEKITTYNLEDVILEGATFDQVVFLRNGVVIATEVQAKDGVTPKGDWEYHPAYKTLIDHFKSKHSEVNCSSTSAKDEATHCFIAADGAKIYGIHRYHADGGAHISVIARP